ncbi:hypothetical protein [Microbacterium sp. UCD-TDU]|uniref:hypothetical protein n=1 Tax=Microbacterium sp. UCD-TDU TaxID=1247714 RepID=UPI00034B8796|nr:hypothetical protein [Microbacterium sp. UCD-TDU]EYT59716.1 hypothetical protein D514_0108125 [Microbacterium sp. UCD-TDU]
MNDSRNKREVCRYDFTDQNGRLAFQKVRYAIDNAGPGERRKTFKYYDPHRFGGIGGFGKPPGADLLIFNLPATLEAIRTGQTVHSTEGEKDADELIKLGYAATSVHQGANKVTLEQMAWLYEAPRVIIWVDKDVEDPSIGAHDAVMRHDHLVKLGYGGEIEFRRARGPWGGLKDVADHLAAGYAVDEAVVCNVTKLLQCASRFTLKANRRAGYGR